MSERGLTRYAVRGDTVTNVSHPAPKPPVVAKSVPTPTPKPPVAAKTPTPVVKKEVK